MAPAAISTDAIMPSIDQLSAAASLSALKHQRILQAAEKDLRLGRVQVPAHLPASDGEPLKWAYISRLRALLGEAAFDRALHRALIERHAA